jgi:hypothetical protein
LLILGGVINEIEKQEQDLVGINGERSSRLESVAVELIILESVTFELIV